MYHTIEVVILIITILSKGISPLHVNHLLIYVLCKDKLN